MKKWVIAFSALCFVMMLSADAQSTWREITLPPLGSQLTMVDFADSLAGWLFADNGAYMKTSDGGKTWIVDSIGVPMRVEQIKAFSDTVCWAVARDAQYNGAVYATTDGKAWNAIPIPDSISSSLYGKAGFPSPSTIWYPSGKGVFVSSDHGRTWSPNKSKFSMRCDIEFADSLLGYLAFSTIGPGGERPGYTFKTTDGGAHWDSIAHDYYTSNWEIKFYNSSYGYYLSEYIGMDGYPRYQTMSATNDGGASVHGVQTGNYSIYSILGILQYRSGKELLVARGNRMKRGVSDTTRFLLSTGTEGDSVIAFESVPETFNWILGAGNRLYQSVGIPTVVQSESPEIARSFSLNNYPNPFNPATTIAFTIPSKMFVTLKVYDLLGRETASILSEELAAGAYSRTWRAAGLPSGIYLCRLQAGAYSSVTRLLLLK